MEYKNCLTIWGENVRCKLTELTPLPLKPTAKQLIVPARLVLPWSNWKADSQIWILLNMLLPAWWLHSREKQVSISQLTSGLQSIYISMFQVKGIATIRFLAALRSKLCVLGQVCWEKKHADRWTEKDKEMMKRIKEMQSGFPKMGIWARGLLCSIVKPEKKVIKWNQRCRKNAEKTCFKSFGPKHWHSTTHGLLCDTLAQAQGLLGFTNLPTFGSKWTNRKPQ